MARNDKIVTIVLTICCAPCCLYATFLCVFKAIALSVTGARYKKKMKSVSEIKPTHEGEDDLESKGKKG